MKTSPEIKPSQYNAKAKFNYYNRVCFNGELPHVPVAMRKLKGKSGLCHCQFVVPPEFRRIPKRAQLQHAKLIEGSVRITLNSAYLRTEEEFDAILIHEMIHAKFYFEEDFVETHGPNFERIREECERKVGFSIPVTENLDDPTFHNLQPKEFILLYRPKGSGEHGSFALINPKHWETHGRMICAEWSMLPQRFGPLHVYRVTNRHFTRRAHRMKVQRPKAVHKIGFYLANEDDIRVLDDNAELVYTASYGKMT